MYLKKYFVSILSLDSIVETQFKICHEYNTFFTKLPITFSLARNLPHHYNIVNFQSNGEKSLEVGDFFAVSCWKKKLLCNPFKFRGVFLWLFLLIISTPLGVFPIANFSWKRPVAQSSDTKCLLGKRLFITVKVYYVTVPVASPVGYIS